MQNLVSTGPLLNVAEARRRHPFGASQQSGTASSSHRELLCLHHADTDLANVGEEPVQTPTSTRAVALPRADRRGVGSRAEMSVDGSHTGPGEPHETDLTQTDSSWVGDGSNYL